MISHTSSLQPESQIGILAVGALTNGVDLGQSGLSDSGILNTNNPFIYQRVESVSINRKDFDFFSANYSFAPRSSESGPNLSATTVRKIPAEFIFPLLGCALPALFELSFNDQGWFMKFEIDEGVILVMQSSEPPILNGDRAFFKEGAAKINVTSYKPRAHFIAASLQTLLLMDSSAILQVPEVQFHANIHFNDSLAIIGKFLQRRQFAYRLMVIEKALNQEFPIPPLVSNIERSTTDFVYRAVTERSFLWQFVQELYPFEANEHVRDLLQGMDGTNSFRIEIGSFQQGLLGQMVNLGEVNVTIQKAALANPQDVNLALQKLDGNSFEATIKSLSGAAAYEFMNFPSQPDFSWDPQIEHLIKLEMQFDKLYFDAINQIAAASFDEETALEQEQLLKELPFGFDEDGDSDLVSRE